MGRKRSKIVIVLFISFLVIANCEEYVDDKSNNKERKMEMEMEQKIIQVKSEPNDVVWVVQLSDLHFSVHHPHRALDFKSIVGPTLSFINPSLVLITGDLTDATSKDLLTMKQDEKEWIEYQQIMEETVRKSGLDKNIFYDIRGNHDNFGVSSINGSSDFFSTYSHSASLNRTELVNSVVIQTGERDILFVGFDSTTTPGLRGPTNLFGHPTDHLINDISSALSHQDTLSMKPTTKIAFGHFTLSFSAASSSGKTLKNTFLTNSLSAYICGHLHTEYGPNLKRHHKSNDQFLYPFESVQLKPISVPLQGLKNCSAGLATTKEFWELEIGDWREHRTMRVLVVDRGHISFTDIDFQTGPKKTIIVPTFPLDSRFLPRSYLKEKCSSSNPSFGETIRALVFSESPIVSVVARIYDSKSSSPIMETSMGKHESVSSRGDLYSMPWNSKVFDDPSPLRFWLQVEAIDAFSESTLSELRPFSVGGIHAKFSWTRKEFYLMGCHWSDLYLPALWLFYCQTLAMIIIPKVVLTISRKQYSYRNLCANKGIMNCLGWIFTEFYKLPLIWCSISAYVFYLMVCPWLYGHVFTDDKIKGYMTSRGWVLKEDKNGETEFLGFPDILVVVMPHLYYVVSPAIFVVFGFCVERSIYRDRVLRLLEKKEDDNVSERSVSHHHSSGKISRLRPFSGVRWMRKLLLLASFKICWEHFKHCRDIVKAYEMNPITDFPVYGLAIPLFLAYIFYKTGKI